MNGKLQGHAQRVQVPDGSVTELTTVLNTETTADEINAAFKAAFSDTDYYGYNDEASSPPTSSATPTVACSTRPRPTSTPLMA